MNAACPCHPKSELDLRELAPRIRHPKIFETFDALRPGGSFVLVNDHDPRPLYYLGDDAGVRAGLRALPR